jgi:hypothetical protein
MSSKDFRVREDDEADLKKCNQTKSATLAINSRPSSERIWPETLLHWMNISHGTSITARVAFAHFF